MENSAQSLSEFIELITSESVHHDLDFWRGHSDRSYKLGTPEKVRSTAAQLVLAINTR